VCFRGPDQTKYIPPSHDVAVAAEHLRQTADDHIRILQNVDVDKITDRLIDYYAEIVLVGQLAYPLEVW
jgi:hypothetical protein